METVREVTPRVYDITLPLAHLWHREILTVRPLGLEEDFITAYPHGDHKGILLP